MNKSTLSLAVLAALVAGGASAADGVIPEETQRTQDTRTAEPRTGEPKTGPAAKAAPGQQRQIDKLAAEFGVTKDEVSALRDKGLGWGEARHVLTLSRESGKPVEDIVKMHEDGMSWGEISKKEGVKLDGLNKGSMGRENVKPGGDRGSYGNERGTTPSDRGNIDRPVK